MNLSSPPWIALSTLLGLTLGRWLDQLTGTVALGGQLGAYHGVAHETEESSSDVDFSTCPIVQCSPCPDVRCPKCVCNCQPCPELPTAAPDASGLGLFQAIGRLVKAVFELLNRVDDWLLGIVGCLCILSAGGLDVLARFIRGYTPSTRHGHDEGRARLRLYRLTN